MTLEQDPAAKDPRNDLVVRARTDREAFGQLYDAYYPGVFRYCFRRLFVRAVAEDVTSEVFLSVASKMRQFARHDRGRFSPLGVPDRHQRGERLCAPGQATQGAAGVGGAERHAGGRRGSRPRPSDMETLDWPALYQAILSLKPRDQAIVVLRFFEQMSHEQIAAVLGERPATVRVGLSRALEKLRRRFKMDDDPIAVPGVESNRYDNCAMDFDENTFARMIDRAGGDDAPRPEHQSNCAGRCWRSSIVRRQRRLVPHFLPVH